MARLLLLTHLVSTLFLVGLIWTIQVVHYPLFERVGLSAYPSYQAGHQWRITVVVLPLMLVELLSAVWLIFDRPPAIPTWLIWAGLGLLILIWISTVFIQSPLHSTLDRGFDRKTWLQLVNTNWIRTVAWSVRGLFAVWMIALVMKV